jgi:hypothetical protein
MFRTDRLEAAMKNSLMLGLATAVFLAALPAGAQSYYQYTTVYGAPVPYSPWAPGARGPSAEQWTQEEYHQSGTLGRMGLGASPYHPEGPGNFSSPR